ncbi:MAG: 50S ribosomal protein L9 [Actinomycetota bacterium]|jgi:large subunit ribosomal protein L9|nr:50S ribosomal protein L9 [Actinomycetota bacterium]
MTKVLLRRDVEGIGRRGDIVDVSDGYARNFLIPGGLGLAATKGIQAQATSMRRARDLRDASDRQAAEAKARVLAGATLRIAARAGATGRLFGSVGVVEIADAAREQKGVEVDRHAFSLEEPIKATGTYEVPVRLFGDIATAVMVEVVPAG